jgi:hypothetical protein
MTLSFAICGTLSGLAGQAPTWTVSDDPIVSIGDSDARGHDLFQVRGAARLVDGSVAVLSAGTHDIRIFDTNGVQLRTVGRLGQGPGEFVYPEGVRFIPDGGAIVVDRDNERVTTFDTNWDVAEERNVPYSAFRWPLAPPGAPLAGGQVPIVSLSVSIHEAVRRDEGVYEDSIVIDVIDDEKVGYTLHLSGRAFLAKVGGLGLRRPIPFDAAPLYTSGEDRVVIGSSHRRDFEAFGSDGAAIGAYHMHGEASRASRADWTHYQRRLRAEFQDPLVVMAGVSQNYGPQVERFLAEVPRGDTIPFFDYLHVDRESRLWVREYSVPNRVAWWQVASVADGVIGRVALPWGAEVLDAGLEHVVTLEHDEFDVELVRVYHLKR